MELFFSVAKMKFLVKSFFPGISFATSENPEAIQTLIIL